MEIQFKKCFKILGDCKNHAMIKIFFKVCKSLVL